MCTGNYLHYTTVSSGNWERVLTWLRLAGVGFRGEIRYGRTIISLGDEGSWNFTPRDWFDLNVSGRSSDES